MSDPYPAVVRQADEMALTWEATYEWGDPEAHGLKPLDERTPDGNITNEEAWRVFADLLAPWNRR